jgi:capsular polysaccharide biosynthesis protein
MLDSREKGERLVQYEDLKRTLGVQGIRQVMEYIANNCSAIISPHGGGLYNARFAGKGALVVEILPSEKFEAHFWEQARLSEQEYIMYRSPSRDADHNMRINDVSEVVDIVAAYLGRVSEDALIDSYRTHE